MLIDIYLTTKNRRYKTVALTWGPEFSIDPQNLAQEKTLSNRLQTNDSDELSPRATE